ncbi:hypothetical protein [Mucilaginibacter sp.]|uniref:hypothetical protein n=1 Tax=Mucilaginibacter sp. TaxID=1882438 RepID=UPI003D104A71
MHIAYSALNTTNKPSPNKVQQKNNERLLRYQAYQTTCNKYSREIAAIQKYLPGWMPEFK